MPTRKPPKELDPSYLERAAVQLNTRIPLSLRLEIEEYLDFMSKPEHRRPANTSVWPTSIAGLVARSIEEFLRSHPTTNKRGPDRPVSYTKIKKTSKIKAKTPKPDPITQGYE